jgi:hypothetical protein
MSAAAIIGKTLALVFPRSDRSSPRRPDLPDLKGIEPDSACMEFPLIWETPLWAWT